MALLLINARVNIFCILTVKLVSYNRVVTEAEGAPYLGYFI